MGKNSEMPKDPGLDHSLELLKEGYNFISNRRREMDTSVFETRLLGIKLYCLSGSDAARLFYDETKFKRAGVAPLPIKKTLFGEGGVQGLDDEEHRHRKSLYMSLWTEDAILEIRHLIRHYYAEARKNWEQREAVTLYDEAKQLLTRMVCAWVGVPLQESEVTERADQLSAMYEEAAHVSLEHVKGWQARSQAEYWINSLVSAVRNGDIQVDEDRPLFKFCWHRDEQGEFLDVKVVSVEILNLLRPTVANSVWITFIARAIHDYPQAADKVRTGDPLQLHYFCQEVRRFYPFFPFAAAKVRERFDWQGYRFEEGTMTLLDLYGTNHHPHEWTDPDTFNPGRFETTSQTPFNFMPQGGGDYVTGHRCAGEWVTRTVLEESLNYLVNRLDYHLPEQDLSFSMTDIPAIINSGVCMVDIKKKVELKR